MSQKSRDSAESDPQNEELNPFWLRDAFPDPQGIFDARHATLQEIKDDCFVALDANVLLLPFKLDGVDLKAVTDVYRPLAQAKRLVIPAQAAREFAKHRSTKVGELVQYLRNEASLAGPKLGKKVGALAQHDEFIATKKKVEELSNQIREVQQAINAVADSIAMNVGGDPVSVAYQAIFAGTVQPDPDDCNDAAAFQLELRQRYEAKRPPGFKDKTKPDSGAGDLLIWKTLLAEGQKRKTSCIFVTADEKADWYTQSGGPFQPRFELLEEYRIASGSTLHIIPLSKLLHIFDVSNMIVDQVRNIEKSETAHQDNILSLMGYPPTRNDRSSITSSLMDEIILLKMELEDINGNFELLSDDMTDDDMDRLDIRRKEIKKKLNILNWRLLILGSK